jgi:SnoaL-like domain/SnoaL-like polyketide cyclase
MGLLMWNQTLSLLVQSLTTPRLRGRRPVALGVVLGAPLAVASVFACSGESVAPPPKAPVGSLTPNQARDAGPDTVTAKERTLPGLYAEALSSADSGDGGVPFAGLAPLLDPDLAGFQSPGAAPAHESNGIIRAHANLFGAFDDRKMQITRIWRTPAEQTFEWVMSGTQARDWKGVAATHKPVSFKGVTLLWTKDDGSLTDIHVYFDVAAVKALLGAPGPKELAGLTPTAAPTGAPQSFEQAQPPTATESSNVAAAKASLDALENNNEPAYVGSMTDDVEVDTLEKTAAIHGKEGVRGYYKAMHKAIGQLDTSVLGEWGVGKYALVEYSINGEQLGPIGWVPAQRDKVVRFETVDICELEGGKIAHVWRYDSPAELVGSGRDSTP